jgi:hypothetical protein
MLQNNWVLTNTEAEVRLQRNGRWERQQPHIDSDDLMAMAAQN